MSSAPRVSVVTPFLDPPVPFFREAIESVLAQTFQGWELLLVNDGSGSEATEVASAYAEDHPGRIRVLGREGGKNRGAAPSRNVALAQARGEVVALLDSDDVWLPDRLEVHLSLVDAHPSAGMICGPSLYWWSWDGSTSDTERPEDFSPPLGVPPNQILHPPGILPVFLRGEGAVPCPTAVTARRDMVEAVGGFQEDFVGPFAVYEDQAFFAKMALHHPMIVTDRVLDRYRQAPRSITATTSADRERKARVRFLRWLREYVGSSGWTDAGLRRTVATELWAAEHPLGGRLLRTLRRVGRRMGAAGRRLSDSSERS
jgi:glycosyltransferase involved in cell wall biosynthesis